MDFARLHRGAKKFGGGAGLLRASGELEETELIPLGAGQLWQGGATFRGCMIQGLKTALGLKSSIENISHRYHYHWSGGGSPARSELFRPGRLETLKKPNNRLLVDIY
jgi:hypothetical protein